MSYDIEFLKKRNEMLVKEDALLLKEYNRIDALRNNIKKEMGAIESLLELEKDGV